MKINLQEPIDIFSERHNSPSKAEIGEMLGAIGVSSLDELIDQTVPSSIRNNDDLDLPDPLTEADYITRIKSIAGKNQIFKNFIGQGYYGCTVPAVIQRNILENPGWYTAYTPYQAEIAQGRLEALLNFQTMISDLTGMEIANASLLDEATAAAEAMSMFYGLRKGKKKEANVFLVDRKVFPQTKDVILTRAEPIGVKVEITDISQADLSRHDVFGMYFQYPDNSGEIIDRSGLTRNAKENELLVAVGTDLLALCLITPPGEWGADVVVGTSQRFGVPLGYGGPHAAFYATKEAYKRAIPGRIIGVSKDSEDQVAYRMALQTREQHIKRERATSNICTAQVLLAIMSSMYAVYHGPERLKKIAAKVHGLAKSFSKALEVIGMSNHNQEYFDTVYFEPDDLDSLKNKAEKLNTNFRYHEGKGVSVSFDETHTLEDVSLIIGLLSNQTVAVDPDVSIRFSEAVNRQSAYLEHPVFNTYQTEHEMLRYMKQLENKDISLVHSMISLGSCTMKLNATTEMIPVTWPEFANIHPFAPEDQTEGYQQMINELGLWLTEITGFAGISFQPNSGAQGEFSGLMVIRAFHHAHGNDHRDVALIPSSAHGTNPASAVMAGMKVVIVKCDDHGNIDMNDLKEKAEAHSDNLGALMITYPSTHGVFESEIKKICELIHSHGGQVYMDGANMNAQVGITSPGTIGADVCHLNLHKTFCIPHGGGGPGMGPIGVAKHLVPFLPGNDGTDETGHVKAVAAAKFGSASILPISHAYISMMGPKGLADASKLAILNANYIAEQIKGHYKILYRGNNDRNAHELIIDCREFKHLGVEVEDIAKRMIDYGYHAPTVSFPVPGTMMIEPTESETKKELDQFCEVLISIRNEISEIEKELYPQDNNVLKNAPHTYRIIVNDNWDRPYSREKAAFPLESLRFKKFWPSVGRVDGAYGDRHLFCSCVPVAEYDAEPNDVLIADI